MSKNLSRGRTAAMLEFISLLIPWLAVSALVIAAVLAIGGWGRLAFASVLIALLVFGYWMYVTVL